MNDLDNKGWRQHFIFFRFLIRGCKGFLHLVAGYSEL